jgi:hypothetical protein
MAGPDFEELFKSPLDAPPGDDERGWLSPLLGVLTGLVATSVVLLILGGGGDAAATTTSNLPTATPTSAAPAAPAPDYPAGYVEMAPDLAARPVATVVGDETIRVSFVTVVARDADPLAPRWPLGGSWVLQAADGSAVASDRVILYRFSPGIFAVEFHLPDSMGPATPLARITMTERWDQHDITDSISLPYAGPPFVVPEPLDLPLGTGAALVLSDVEYGRYQGQMTWNVTGCPAEGSRVVAGATFLDDSGTAIGSYGEFPTLIEPSAAGIIYLTWEQPFRINQEGTETVRLDYTVGLVSVVATDVSFDLTDLPTGR